MNDPGIPLAGSAAAFREAAVEISRLSGRLLPQASSFGPEGAESVGLIESAARSIISALDSALSAGDGGPERLPSDRRLRHDFGNWFQTVGGFTTLLLMEPSVAGEARDSLERIERRNRELVRLLEEQP